MSRTHDFYAITPPGLESIAAEELRELAAHAILPDKGGVAFSGSDDLMMRINVRARSLTRVLMRLNSFKALSFPELYNKCRRIDWSRFLPPGMPVSIHAACHSSKLMHSDRVSQTLEAAITDRLGNPLDDRKLNPQQVYARIDRDTVTLSLDTSGERLDRRGYRLNPAHAPLRETIAAALLHWAGWNGNTPLMVPMCGSGTLAIEAAWIAMHRAPNIGRNFPFQSWPAISERRWQRVLAKASAMQCEATGPILASDIDPNALEAAKSNAMRAQVSAVIAFSLADAFTLKPLTENGLIVCNPPYGQRLGRDVGEMYKKLGRLLQNDFGEWQRIVLVPNQACEQALGLKARRRLAFRHGGYHVQALELS